MRLCRVLNLAREILLEYCLCSCPITMSHDEPDTGLEDVWYLRDIFWSLDKETPKQPVKIITQNFNGEYYYSDVGTRSSRQTGYGPFLGPCSFIAICEPSPRCTPVILC